MKQKLSRSSAALFLVFTGLAFLWSGCSGSGNRSADSSGYQGVQIGAITYSWRSMPSTPEDIIQYCEQTGINTLELMGDVAERYAGAPEGPVYPENYEEFSEEERADFQRQLEEHAIRTTQWRIHGAPAERYRELKELFDEAGIQIHAVKFSPADWSDEEIDYAFESARILGAKAVTDEIGIDAAIRLGPFAEKHDMYAVFHNHSQPRDTAFHFEDFLAFSPNNMLNLDVGHYFGATGLHPNELITDLHDRIYSIHMKDKTGPLGYPPDTNARWGQGDTPLADILRLIKVNQWDIYCDVELEYEIPEGSSAVIETAKCVKYARDILESVGE